MKRNPNEILFAAYLAVVLSLTYASQFSAAPVFWLGLLLVFFIPAYFISRPVFNLVGKAGLHPDKTPYSKYLWFAGFFAAAFISMVLWYIKYYPGWFSGDSELQYSQALSGTYNDWHPVLQTIITFTFPLKLTGGWKGSVILFQIIEYSLVLSYMAETIWDCGSRKFAFFAFLIVILNPVTGAIVKQPWKDVTFAMAALLMLCYSLRIVKDETWVRKPLNLFLLALSFAVASIVRHNGILFTIPLAILIVLKITPKSLKFGSAALMLVFFVLIKGPFYDALGVTDPGSRKVETLGLPMTVIGNVVKESPDCLDSETLDFAYSIAPKEVWNEYYTCGDFNGIKFNGNIDTQPIEDAGYVIVLKYMFRCFKASPKDAFKALVDVTKMVYAVTGEINWSPEFIPPKLLSPIIKTPLRYITLFAGLENIMVLLFGLAKKKFQWALPLLIHNFGTMVLLTGPDYRFFYLTYPVAPVLIFTMLQSSSGENAETL